MQLNMHSKTLFCQNIFSVTNLLTSRSRFLPAVCQFRNGFVYNNPMLSLAGELIAEMTESTLPQMVYF